MADDLNSSDQPDSEPHYPSGGDLTGGEPTAGFDSVPDLDTTTLAVTPTDIGHSSLADLVNAPATDDTLDTATPATAPATATTGTVDSSTSPDTASAAQAAKRKQLTIIGAAAAAVLLLIVLVVVFTGGDDSADKSTSATATTTEGNTNPDDVLSEPLVSAPGNRYELSPDGRWIAINFNTPAWTVYEVATGEEQLTLPDANGGVQFSPDGAKLVALGMLSAGVWDIESATQGMTTNEEFRGFSPDGSVVLTALCNYDEGGGFEGCSVAHTWNTENGERIAEIGGFRGYPTFTGTGEVAAPSNRGVGLWSATSGELAATLDVGETVFDLAFSPNGAYVLADNSGDMRVVDLALRRIVYRYSNDALCIDTTFGAGNTIVVVDRCQQTFEVRDLATDAVLAAGPYQGYATAAVNAAASRFVHCPYSTGDPGCIVWDLGSGEQNGWLPVPASIATAQAGIPLAKQVVFSANGQAAVSLINSLDASTLGTYLYDLETLAASHALTGFGDIEFGPDGDTIAGVFLEPGADPATSEVRIYHVDGLPQADSADSGQEGAAPAPSTTAPATLPPQPTTPPTNPASAGPTAVGSYLHGRLIALSPDGKTATFGGSPTSAIWAANNTQSALATIPEQLWFGEFNADGSLFLGKSNGQSAHIYDANTGAMVATIAAGGGSLGVPGFVAGGSTVASLDGLALRVWDARTGAELNSFSIDGVGISEWAVSGDGTTFAAVTPNGVTIIDAASGTMSAPFANPFPDKDCTVDQPGLSTDGGLLVARVYCPPSLQPVVAVWNTDTAALVAQVETGLNRIPMSADTRRIAVVDTTDNTVRVIDSATGSVVATLTADVPNVNAVDIEISPNGKYVVVVDYQGTTVAPVVYDAATGAQLYVLPFGTEAHFSADSKLIAATLACDNGACSHTVYRL